MGGRVFQRDLKKPGNISDEARNAWWIEIHDCAGAPIREKIGPREIANRVLHKLEVQKDEGRLYKVERDQTINDLCDIYEKAKVICVANPKALHQEVTFIRKRFGHFKCKCFSASKFKRIRKAWQNNTKTNSKEFI